MKWLWNDLPPESRIWIIGGSSVYLALCAMFLIGIKWPWLIPGWQ